MAAPHVPIGIDAESYHIVTRTMFLESVKDEIVALGVVGTIQMNDDLCIGKYLFHSGIACIGKACILVHIILCTTYRPQETVGGLVAYLHPTHLYPSLFYGLQDIAGMVGQGLTHLLVAHVFPRRRNVLLTGISPPVTIVEVYHQRHAPVLGTSSHADDIALVAESVLRINPDTQTDGIETQFAHQGGTLTGVARAVAQLNMTCLEVGRATDVSTQPKGLLRADRQRDTCKEEYSGNAYHS